MKHFSNITGADFSELFRKLKEGKAEEIPRKKLVPLEEEVDMACSCHGKNGESVHTVRPYDQCTACARKHVKNAWSKWGEFCYEEVNRDYVSAQLRDAADHLKFDHRETALKCRDLAMAIEENKDMEYGSIAAALDELRTETRNLYYADHPEAAERLVKLNPDVRNPILS